MELVFHAHLLITLKQFLVIPRVCSKICSTPCMTTGWWRFFWDSYETKVLCDLTDKKKPLEEARGAFLFDWAQLTCQWPSTILHCVFQVGVFPFWNLRAHIHQKRFTLVNGYWPHMDAWVGGSGRGGASSSKQQTVLHVTAFVDTAISPVSACEHLTENAEKPALQTSFPLASVSIKLVLVILLELLLIFAVFKVPGPPPTPPSPPALSSLCWRRPQRTGDERTVWAVAKDKAEIGWRRDLRALWKSFRHLFQRISKILGYFLCPHPPYLFSFFVVVTGTIVYSPTERKQSLKSPAQAQLWTQDPVTWSASRGILRVCWAPWGV